MQSGDLKVLKLYLCSIQSIAKFHPVILDLYPVVLSFSSSLHYA